MHLCHFIHVLLYENTYLCKDASSQKFSKICTKDFVCNQKNIQGVDYILDQSKKINSLITDYDIYCSNVKITMFGISFFVFGSLGIIINPYIIKTIGTLDSIFYNILGYGILFIILALVKNYYVGIIVYCLMMAIFIILITTIPFYIVEMSKPSFRSVFICLSLTMMAVCGLMCNLITYLTGDYNITLYICSCISFISLIFIKIVLVDSVRSNFIRGRFKQIFIDLEKIAIN